jgi:pimeloyl-ACP methyl ester carboxylesterase
LGRARSRTVERSAGTVRDRDFADCLIELLDHIGVEHGHVVGLSWGGLLAQELYRREPARVLSLVLADTYAGWRGSLGAATAEERLAACTQDSKLPADELVARYLPGMVSSAATRAVRDEVASIMVDFHAAGFRLMAQSLADSDTRDLLRGIKVPTLLVWGEADVRSPLSVACELQALVSGARLVVFPEAGHLSNVEAPVRFNDEVRAFCLRQPE